jgi:hypothetical protein
MFKKIVAILLSGALVWGGLAAQVSAAMIETGDVLSIDARQDRITTVQAQLARDDVQRAMMELGVDPQEARHRVASLSDQELLLLEEELESLPAGGDGFFALLGVVFVVLLILELVGVTNIFTRA